MPSFNKRNSRDDNSKSARGSFTKNPAKKNSNARDGQEKPAFRDRKTDTPYGKPQFRDRNDSGPQDRPKFRDRKDAGPYGKPQFRDRKDDGPYGKPQFRDRKDTGPYGKPQFRDRKDDGPQDRPKFRDRKEAGPYGKPQFRDRKDAGPYGKPQFRDRKDDGPQDRPKFRDRNDSGPQDRPKFRDRKDAGPHGKPKFRDRKDSSKNRFESEPANDGLIRLNRYISNAGICSRRKADELIEAGVVSVNGEVVTTLGAKVDPAKDEIRYNGERLKREKMVYVLLNKPKDYITTTDDPQERRTVMQLVAKATRERIYPVGRLDRNTTGLLLLTNDGFLSEKLSHPRNHISKLYYVELDKNLTQGDFNKIAFGLELEDGFVKPDDLNYVQGSSKSEVGIQIHSGKNRIVRRIFEHLGYDVVKLDRVVYANLTKKDLPRGHWRYLDEHEIVQLKHLIK